VTDRLRSITLRVYEQSPGAFWWRLSEGAGLHAGDEAPIAAADAPFGNYSQAVRAGADAMIELAAQSAQGPRTRA
jgi:hypothetical protein